jgi:sialic acid synthase SpsE
VHEIRQTLSFINKIDSNFIRLGKLAILHCNTAYPTPKQDSYLGTINYLKKIFKVCTGFSDHSIGDEIITYAYILGAKIIEKHFSNNIKKKSFRDHEISLNKEGVDSFLIKINKIKNYLEIKRKLTASEKNQKNSKSFRRSIYAKKDIQKGVAFSSKNLISLRPYQKTSSNMYFKLIKKKAQKPFKKGDVVN